MCSNENMEVGGHRKIGRPDTEVERSYKIRHEGERSKDIRSQSPDNVEIENLMR